MNRRQLLTIAGLVCLAILAAVIYRVFAPADDQRQIAPSANQARSAAAGRVIPVVTTPAKSEDFSIRRRTIGVLESPATVVVRSRIDSQVLEQHVTDGQMVKKGDLLFTLDDREVLAAIARDEAALARDRATQTRTEADLARARELVSRNVASQQQLDQAIADNKGAAATVASDQAQLQTDQLRLAYTKIQAPIDGRIGAIRVTPGNLVSAAESTGLVTITQIQPIRVSFTLPERDLTALRKAAAQTPPATVRVYSSGSTEPLAAGDLDFVDSAVDVSSGTIAARATFPNRDLTLWPGQFVDVEITLDVRPNTVMIPTVAIQTGQQGPFVFIAKPDRTAEMRKVQLAGTDGSRTAISSGIRDGERIVVEGQMNLADGTRLSEVARNEGPDQARGAAENVAH